jgi:hypothetical protein
LRLRDEKVVAKGKGELITFWLEVKSATSGSKSSYSSGNGDDISKNSSTNNDSKGPNRRAERSQKSKKSVNDKIDRLIDWNTDNLARLLQQIVNSRQSGIYDEDSAIIVVPIKSNPFDEVKEIIALPQVKKSKIFENDSSILISNDVLVQLRDYVSRIASMYNDNYFHNFEHVCILDFMYLHCVLAYLQYFTNFFLLCKTLFTTRHRM